MTQRGDKKKETQTHTNISRYEHTPLRGTTIRYTTSINHPEENLGIYKYNQWYRYIYHIFRPPFFSFAYKQHHIPYIRPYMHDSAKLFLILQNDSVCSPNGNENDLAGPCNGPRDRRRRPQPIGRNSGRDPSREAKARKNRFSIRLQTIPNKGVSETGVSCHQGFLAFTSRTHLQCKCANTILYMTLANPLET